VLWDDDVELKIYMPLPFAAKPASYSVRLAVKASPVTAVKSTNKA
jgi:hypothetical protein